MLTPKALRGGVRQIREGNPKPEEELGHLGKRRDALFQQLPSLHSSFWDSVRQAMVGERVSPRPLAKASRTFLASGTGLSAPSYTSWMHVGAWVWGRGLETLPPGVLG